ncbi:MAG: DUF2905 family protein [Firmicutes bacterium]|nr:DUF2905 family protein [Bacillota bacterium]
MARLLFWTGVLFLLAALVVRVWEGLPAGWRWLPFHLPGDVVIHKGSFTFFLPITTSILLSLLLTLILWLLRR